MLKYGVIGDPAIAMYRQATLGDVDFITGDYLAGTYATLPIYDTRPNIDVSLEVNIANNAEAYAQGKHAGYEETAWDGLQQTIDVIAKKRIKIAINGGALNPEGLATRVAKLVSTCEDLYPKGSKLTTIADRRKGPRLEGCIRLWRQPSARARKTHAPEARRGIAAL
jgi:hypothetical protein